MGNVAVSSSLSLDHRRTGGLECRVRKSGGARTLQSQRAALAEQSRDLRGVNQRLPCAGGEWSGWARVCEAGGD